ncbi:hypothetical protein TWF225_008187 [Orbilia oligospora]|uniref:N-acetyltransferase domain-containing protein n=1 Tax=Orbilia oligospora TaxID=2813651 RepID=A0A8H2E1I0_ORBOL|nr:hypothetical protein TWF225_008187 [Orbilia oligospora]KAF3246441.1 hypothetical protein TWF128_008905 [Orbilia oligospora]KAF3268901.1 hypothetical protein TWF217_010189 [Orbilia oligospora]KAF3292804.1 hypothetical protein TWF132_005173 [Orbilia oligospora]TGJ67749.1 hypothetical protein EYR41_006860 [Orbilia oligospora]
MQQPNTPAPTYHIIPATPFHIPQITAIVNHYILTTIVNKSYRSLPESHYQNILTDNHSRRKLPFFVAIEVPQNNDNGDSSSIEGAKGEKVIGFITVTPWFPSKLGYAYTLEVSLYISPTQRGGGIGTALLTTLISHLEGNEYFTFSEGGAVVISSSPSLSSSKVPDEPNVVHGIPVKCTQLLALMAIVEDTELDGKVRGFYEKQGFEVMGVMRGVGWKFGKRRNVRMLAREMNVGYIPDLIE